MSDARTGKRFRLQLPIRIAKPKSKAEHDGVTDDVSAAGVYIRANAALEVGSEVEFQITLPAKVIGAAGDVQIQCRGRVVRTETKTKTSTGRKGLACVIDNYEFIRNF